MVPAELGCFLAEMECLAFAVHVASLVADLVFDPAAAAVAVQDHRKVLADVEESVLVETLDQEEGTNQEEPHKEAY